MKTAVSDEGGADERRNVNPDPPDNDFPLDEALLESLGVDDLVPRSLDRWRPLVAEGVLFFLQGLSPERHAEIWAAQLALSDTADAGQRLVALLTQCPTLHKLGQVVARHQGLPAELRKRLTALESLAAATPMADVLASIHRELPAGALVTIGAEALAEASVAVVVPFTWEEEGALRHGVFKVLRPGVESRLAQELSVWLELGGFLERRGLELGRPALDYRDTLDSVRELLASEVRLDGEQANLAAAAELYADEPRVQVPGLLPWCTPRMTAMERVFGTKVTDAAVSHAAREAMADALVSALLARPFWNRTDPALFHADPHAGNLFATDDGRVALLDWALVGRLSKAHREAVVDAALGGLTLDAARTCRAIASLGTLAPDDRVLRAAVERGLQRVRQLSLPGFDWLVTILDEVASQTEAGFRDDLILFRKAWFTLAGVLHDVAGQRGADGPLIEAGLQRFAAELPERMLAPFGSRHFATHVSNADLMTLWMTSGLVPQRYWRGVARDAGYTGLSRTIDERSHGKTTIENRHANR
ncbi:MAG: AarF/UbiB family protein [Gammaproteobacteria bacterium]